MFSRAARRTRTIILTLAVALVVGSASCFAADSVDKYGNRIYISEHFSENNAAQFRDTKASWDRAQHASGPIAENGFVRMQREFEEKKAADASLAAARQQQQEADAVEYAEHRKRQLAQESERKNEKLLAQQEYDAEEILYDHKFIARSEYAARTGAKINAALVCLRKGARYALPPEAQSMATALIEGEVKGKGFSTLGVVCTEAERFAIAMDLYRQCDLGNATDTGTTGGALAGQGRFFVDVYLRQCADKTDERNGSFHEWRYGYDEGWKALACALATADGKLDAEQRHLAASLLAEAINGRSLEPWLESIEKNEACLLVAAAQQSPELAQFPRIQKNYIPLVKKCIWNNAFKTYPALDPQVVPVQPSDLRSRLWWGLATRLVLADSSAYPGTWFAQVRAAKKVVRGALLSAPAKQTLQRALDNWFMRATASPWLREALQADFDLACASPVQKDPKNSVSTLQEDWDKTILVVADEELRGIGFNWFYGQKALSASAAGFLLHAIDRACAVSFDVKGNGYGLWNSVQLLTNFPLAAGKKLPDLGISLDCWRALVIAGEAPNLNEAFTYFDSTQKPPVPSKDRLRQIRRDILGESAGELALPEYSKKPADLRQSLLILAEREPTPASRHAMKELLAHVENIVDPATVLAIAEIRGPYLGDWAQLGVWLDDPRRRPTDTKNPLYAIYQITVRERNMVAGRLADISLDSPENAIACEELQHWLEAVLAATGDQRKKLIEDNFPAIIYCPDTDSPYPDLRMVGYDIAQGGFASRALLLLSSAEFNPEEKLMEGSVMVDGDDGKTEKIGGYDVEPWLAAVAKLPRTVTPEALLAELSAGVKVRRAYLAIPEVPSQPATQARELTEEEDGLRRAKEFEHMQNDRRTRWVADGCQEALIRLACRWSPARVPAQAAVLALGDQFLLDDEGKTKPIPSCIVARVAWEQAKMKGLDDATAFAAAITTLPRTELKTLAALANVETRTQPLILWYDAHFAREAAAAVAPGL